MKYKIALIVSFILLGIFPLLSGCNGSGGGGYPKLPIPSSKLLIPKGGFTLFVSNQSLAIDPVDVRVEIDGELVISDYFWVGNQHIYVPFKLSLSEGKHRIHIWSEKGDAEMAAEFEIKDHDVGKITYWYYPKRNDERTLRFNTQKGPLIIV